MSAIHDRVPVVAITQTNRGHGASTMTFYIAQSLVKQGVRVLIGDLSKRQSPLSKLVSSTSMKNLVLWIPPVQLFSQPLPELLNSVQQKIIGHCDCMMLDSDPSILRGMISELDYLAIASDYTDSGKQQIKHLADSLHLVNSLDKTGAIFSRVEPHHIEQIEPRIENGMPVLGSLPADYLLATSDELTMSGAAKPHDEYLGATMKIATTLIRMLHLNRGAKTVETESELSHA